MLHNWIIPNLYHEFLTTERTMYIDFAGRCIAAARSYSTVGNHPNSTGSKTPLLHISRTDAYGTFAGIALRFFAFKEKRAYRFQPQKADKFFWGCSLREFTEAIEVLSRCVAPAAFAALREHRTRGWNGRWLSMSCLFPLRFIQEYPTNVQTNPECHRGCWHHQKTAQKHISSNCTISISP